jgi:branched-chain amino acid transport system substrate-binding protein
VLTPLMLSGCLGDPHVACTSDTECRDAFGFGEVCADDGYCAVAELPPRCSSDIAGLPLDVMENPNALTGGIVLASVHDHNWDVAELQSVRLAVMEAVENGGVDGVPIGLLECTYGPDSTLDDLDENAAAEELGLFLTGRLGIQGYVGPYTSGQSTALFNALSTVGGAFVISPSATSPSLTDIDGVTKTDADPGTFWRTCAPDSFQGQVAAEDMIGRGRTKVAVIYYNDPYGNGLELAFRTRFAADEGYEVVSLQYSDTSTLAGHVATLASDDTVEEVFMISGETADIAAFINAAGAVTGFDDDEEDPYPASGKGIFLSDAAKDTDMLGGIVQGAELLEQVRGSAPAAPDPTDVEYNTFKAAYTARYNQDAEATIYMPYSYDAGWLALYAAAWSVSQDGALLADGMGRGMRHVSSGSAVRLLPTDWNTGRARFSAGESIDVKGTSGPLPYDPVTEETATAVDIWEITASGDDFEVVGTFEPG